MSQKIELKPGLLLRRLSTDEVIQYRPVARPTVYDHNHSSSKWYRVDHRLDKAHETVETRPDKPITTDFYEVLSQYVIKGANTTAKQPRFHKVMFSRSGYGTTSGLVVDASKYDVQDIPTISRLFPTSKAVYMRTYHVSPPYPTFEDAFAHVFDMKGHL